MDGARTVAPPDCTAEAAAAKADQYRVTRYQWMFHGHLSVLRHQIEIRLMDSLLKIETTRPRIEERCNWRSTMSTLCAIHFERKLITRHSKL